VVTLSVYIFFFKKKTSCTREANEKVNILIPCRILFGEITSWQAITHPPFAGNFVYEPLGLKGLFVSKLTVKHCFSLVIV